jgi:MbtH protein
MNLACSASLIRTEAVSKNIQFLTEKLMPEESEDKTIYKVVVNHEEQYSIWPTHRDNALGWKDAGKSGTKEECLSYIKEVWTDMRPLSLRKKMQEQGLG